MAAIRVFISMESFIRVSILNSIHESRVDGSRVLRGRGGGTEAAEEVWFMIIVCCYSRFGTDVNID